jgi:hypothetical protein
MSTVLHQRHTYLRSLVVVAVAVASSTCAELGPPPFVTTELKSISVNAQYLNNDQLLHVTGEAVDTSFRLDPSSRLRARVTTSDGDAEEITFAPQFCNGSYYYCHKLIVAVKEGNDVKALAPQIAPLPARLRLLVMMNENGDTIWVVKDFASLWVYDPVNTAEVSRTVTEMPAVKYVEHDGAGWYDYPPSLSLTLAMRPAARAAVVAGDGVLQFQSGVSVTVEYTQPDGSKLATTVVAQ